MIDGYGVDHDMMEMHWLKKESLFLTLKGFIKLVCNDKNEIFEEFLLERAMATKLVKNSDMA